MTTAFTQRTAAAAVIEPESVSVALPSASDTRPAAGKFRIENSVLAGAALLYILIYVMFWPPIHSTMDEGSYLGFARVLQEGTLYADVAEERVVLALPAHGHHVSKYPLGMSALLALTSLVGGWTFALGTNLLLHLVNFVLVAILLRRQKVPAVLAVLYLLHPTAALYSRTVMSDTASAVLLTLAFWGYLRRNWALAGVLAGLSVLLRTGNAVALPIFCIAALLTTETGNEARLTDLLSRVRSAALFVLGATPFLLAAGYYAVVVADGQMGGSTGAFGREYFAANFTAYTIGLLLVFPGMLLAPLFYRGEGRGVLAGLVYGFLFLYCFWYYRDQGATAVESMIRGLRYFVVVLPLLTVAYGEVLWRLLFVRLPRSVHIGGAVAVVAVLFLVTLMIGKKHQESLMNMARVRDALLAQTNPADVILCNMQVAKLLHPGWGERRYLIPAHTHEETVHTVRNMMANTPRGRLVVATWARPGRQDDRAEVERLKAGVERLLAPARQDAVRPVASGNFPPELTVDVIVTPLSQAVSPSAP